MAPANALLIQQRSKEPSPSLHKSLKPVILIANCLGLFPINGVTCNTLDGVYFSWTSPKTFYSLAMLVVVTAKFIADIPLFLQKGLTHPSSTMTFLSTLHWLMEMLAYIYLAREWPKFIRQWFEVEEALRKAHNYHLKPVDSRIKIQLLVYMVFSTAAYATVTSIYLPKDRTFKLFFVNHYAVYAQRNYSLFYAILHQALHVIRFYSIAFNDIFVIIIGSALALRFKQISARLRKCGLKPTTMSFWSEIRRDYIRLSALCHLANEQISFLIFLSFANNFQAVLFKLFHSTDLYKQNLHQNFFPHITFAIIKLLGTSTYTAWVNDESKGSTIRLNRVPGATYNAEIKKLLMQISFDDVALTGSTMFCCTRSLIISVAGALVTYELVLVQFRAMVSRI